MGVCPVCGCKTDELDFISYRIGGSEEKICSFCEKQLKAFDAGAVTKAHLRWLEAVCEKQVPERGGEITKYLGSLKQAHIKPETGEGQTAQPQAAKPARKAAATGTQQYAFPADAPKAQAAPGVAELEARIAALEKKVDKMKKAQLIRNALEIILPIMLFLLIILVFFASGTYEKLKELFSIATEYMAAAPTVPFDFFNIF